MPNELLDHPVLAGLAFLTALPFAWPLIRVFGRSAEEDVKDALKSPLISYLLWFPEWTLYKFLWLCIVLLALTVTFYKLYAWLLGG